MYRWLPAELSDWLNGRSEAEQCALLIKGETGTRQAALAAALVRALQGDIRRRQDRLKSAEAGRQSTDHPTASIASSSLFGPPPASRKQFSHDTAEVQAVAYHRAHAQSDPKAVVLTLVCQLASKLPALRVLTPPLAAGGYDALPWFARVALIN